MAMRDRYTPAAQTERLKVSAELGKMGFNLKCCEHLHSFEGKSDLLEARAELRRGMNALRDEAMKVTGTDNSANDKRAGELIDAMHGCANLIEDISNQLDMDEAARSRIEGCSSSNGDGVLRDQSGQVIGTMLSNADLREEGKISAKLGQRETRAFDNSDSGGERFTLGDFFRGVAGMRTTDGVRNALSEGTDAAGGYTVPTILLPGILNALVPASSLLQAGANVGILNMQGKSFNIAATDTIPTAAWRNESGNVAESDPAFRSITITPRSLAFRFKLSRELLMDSPGLDVALRVAIAQAFAKELDRAGLRGSGTAPEIRGLLNISGVNAITSGTDGAELANYAKFINASRVIKEANAPAPNAAIMSPREDETMALFADSTGQPLRRPDALANWKFLTTSQIPTDLTVGASTDCSEIYVGDFSQFTFFMREGVSVQMLNELYAGTGEVGFVCHTRVDVAAMYAKAFAIISGVRPPAP